MRVGDYVRSSWGTISKIIEYTACEDDECFGITLEDGTNTFYKHQWQFDNDYKVSSNIIDLIEVGDVIEKIYKTGLIEKIPINKVEDIEDIGIDFKNGFKLSIVTHEQFSQMEYRIGE